MVFSVFFLVWNLLVAVVLQDDQPVTATTWVGRGRRRLCHADVATASSSGEFLLATCGDDTPITVYTVTSSGYSFKQKQENLQQKHAKFQCCGSGSGCKL